MAELPKGETSYVDFNILAQPTEPQIVCVVGRHSDGCGDKHIFVLFIIPYHRKDTRDVTVTHLSGCSYMKGFHQSIA